MADELTRRAARRAALIAVPVAVLAGLLAFWLMGGFRSEDPSGGTSRSGEPSRSGQSTIRPQPSTPVAVPAPALPGGAGATCASLIDRLPATVRDLARREVSAGPAQNAAYGEPPLTIACGTAVPSYPPTATVYQLSRVCWYPVETPGGTAWTTLDRTVAVTVTVPREYEEPGQWVAEFSAPIAATVPPADRAPSGCRA